MASLENKDVIHTSFLLLLSITPNIVCNLPNWMEGFSSAGKLRFVMSHSGQVQSGPQLI